MERDEGKSHPPYRRMINMALKDCQSCSLISIYKFLETHWGIGSAKRTFIRKALAKGLELKLWSKKKATYKLLSSIKKTPKRQSNKSSSVRTKKSSPIVQTNKVRVVKPKAIRPKDETKQSVAQPNMIWTWQFNDNGWCNYHPDASKIVETTYQDYLRNPGVTDVRSVQSGEWNYMVDFRQMTQQNIQHENHTIRRIRRVQLPADQTTYRQRFAN